MYLDGQLVKLTVNDSGTEVVMYLAYDADGTPLSMTYKGTTYYYVTNLQGDVVGILNQSGNVLVSYTYDAWGNILSTDGSNKNTMGKYNPLRYRGYVYDTETGLYYLQSRYYDPETGRFINADSFISTGQGLLGSNMFVYCNNSPNNFADNTGNIPCAVTGADFCDSDIWKKKQAEKQAIKRAKAKAKKSNESGNIAYDNKTDIFRDISKTQANYFYDTIKAGDCGRSIEWNPIGDLIGALGGEWLAFVYDFGTSAASAFDKSITYDPAGNELYLEQGYNVIVIERAYYIRHNLYTEEVYFIYDRNWTLQYNDAILSTITIWN